MALSAVVIPALLAALLAACGGDGGTQTTAEPGIAADTPTSTNGADNVVTGTVVTATFAQSMDAATINSVAAGAPSAFTVRDAAGNNLPGTVSMNADNTEAIFTPSASALDANTTYTATVSTAAKSIDGTALASPLVFSFRTKPVPSTGQAAVNLGAAGPLQS